MPGDSADDLYGLPLERFIPERAALAKTLRGQKRREEATSVAGMRKPSVAAWAVNQLVRTQDKTIQVLFDAGDELARAQAGAASGKRTAAAMRDAAQRQRDALDELLDAAKGLLSTDGHPLSPTTLERVADTLRAASIDEASRRQVADGSLTQELRFAGLGIGGLTAPPPNSPEADTAGAKPTVKREAKGRPAPARRNAQPELEAKRTAAAKRERTAALKAARHSEVQARRAATRAERELAAAQAQREEAAEALEDAERILAAATHRVGATTAELADAERAVRELASTVQ
jgi:hypothetical protein